MKNPEAVDGVVAKLDVARVALYEAKTMQGVKQIADMAKAAEVYAKQQKLGDEAIGYAHSIKIEALRRLGEMLKARTPDDIPKGGSHGGRKKIDGTRKEPSIDVPPTYAEMGLDKKQAHIAQKLAELPDEQFAEVAAGTATVARAIQDVKEARRKEELPRLVLPDGKYSIIYADPPWEYKNSGLGGSANSHYETMGTAKLCALGVEKMAHEDCVLFMWATNPLLIDALSVMKAWGFDYKTNMVWIKDKETYGKLGFYVYGRHELLLIGVKGSLLPTGEKGHSVIHGKTSKHSKKPEEVYSIIELMYPGLKRVELFARNTKAGWESWGNEL